MNIISFDQIVDLSISPEQCCQWVEEALTHKSEAILPKKISLSIPSMDHVFYNSMPCILPSLNRASLKLVTRYPDRIPALKSQLLLYDLESGECIALMDCDWITAMRTGAVAANSIKLLAKKDFCNVGFVGLGNTARATLLCLESYVKNREISIGLLKYKNQHISFKERFDNYNNLTFFEFDSFEKLASWSEVIVSSVTATDQDFASGNLYNSGTLILPIHTRGFTECDLLFEKVFCDDTSHVSNFKYFNEFKSKLAEVSNLYEHPELGRQNEVERIIAYNIGIGLHDLYFATKIEELLQNEVLPTVNLKQPEVKLWV